MGMVVFLAIVGMTLLAVGSVLSDYDNWAIILAIGGIVVLVLSYGVFNAVIEHRWAEWVNCTEGNDEHIRVEACDDYYDLPSLD